jgi:hypothetical protein
MALITRTAAKMNPPSAAAIIDPPSLIFSPASYHLRGGVARNGVPRLVPTVRGQRCCHARPRALHGT